MIFMKKVVYIIDSCVIFLRKAVYDEMVTIPEVISEILDENSKLYLSVKNLRVESASNESIREAMDIAKETGDIHKLSDTDIKLIAKALDELKRGNDVVIVTDDYAIQNVAKRIGIKFEGVIQKKISKEYKWVKVCSGCGRKIKSDICPICGSEAVIRRVRK